MTTHTKPTDSSPSLKNKIFSLTIADLLAIIIGAILLYLGIQMTDIKKDENAQFEIAHSPFTASVVIGLGSALIIYRLLGGIDKDSINVKGKIFGLDIESVGGIATFIVIFAGGSLLLPKEMRKPELTYKPDNYPLVILDHNGKTVSTIKINSSFGSISTDKTITVSPEFVNQVKEICQQEEGFCAPEVKEVVFFINPDLGQTNQGLSIPYASVCPRHKWDSRALLIHTKDHLPIRVKPLSNRDCSSTENPPIIEIDPVTARKLDVDNGVKGSAETAPKELAVPINPTQIVTRVSTN